MDVAYPVKAQGNGNEPSYDKRYEKLLVLAESIRKRRMEIVRAAVADIGFTVNVNGGREPRDSDVSLEN